MCTQLYRLCHNFKVVLKLTPAITKSLVLKREVQREKGFSVESHSSPWPGQTHGHWPAEKGRKAGLSWKAPLASRILLGWKEEGSWNWSGLWRMVWSNGNTVVPCEGSLSWCSWLPYPGKQPEVGFSYIDPKLPVYSALGNSRVGRLRTLGSVWRA